MVGATPAEGTFLQLKDGRFVDDRWVGGRWVLSKFQDAKGETDWDAVIDAGGQGTGARKGRSTVRRAEEGLCFVLPKHRRGRPSFAPQRSPTGLTQSTTLALVPQGGGGWAELFGKGLGGSLWVDRGQAARGGVGLYLHGHITMRPSSAGC